MLKIDMYVRCPIDFNINNPRDFIIGQVVEIDEIAEQVEVIFNDPYNFRAYYELIPGIKSFSIDVIERCELFKGTHVNYKDQHYTIIAVDKQRDKEWIYYYIQSEIDKKIQVIREDEIIAPFTSGRVSPHKQLMNYEFQNPCWYFGRNVVGKTIHVLDHSIYGFKELAGCKIFLMPHQLYTVMRCLQEKECRYMLADEVGLGKTIEACSVLKIYLSKVSHAKVLIVVPKALVKQWEVELLVKFELLVGKDKRNNVINLVSYEEISNGCTDNEWDFVIADEIHNTLRDEKIYSRLYKLSQRAKNILLLSATPVQQEKVEYLKLLKLILPEHYGKFTEVEFEELLQKQKGINKVVCLLLGDVESFEEELEKKKADLTGREDMLVMLHEDEECEELFEEIIEGLNKVSKIINNDQFNSLLKKIYFEDEDFGISAMQIALSYLCEHYQIEKSIIRNRRFFMEQLPTRTCEVVAYELDCDINTYEANAYQVLIKWIEVKNVDFASFEKYFMPLLSAFFSSPWAFLSKLKELSKIKLEIPDDLMYYAVKWVSDEEYVISELEQRLEDPDAINNRLIKIIDYIDQEIIDKKIVIFTNYSETFEQYKTCFNRYFGEEHCAYFKKDMSKDDLELSVYRFQNEKECFIMLCDESGGEGRNFQCADYVIHIDLPWDANAIEQRIGRLDRIGREVERDVKSIVFYTENTIEEQLFRFWDEGLKLFTQSLSGLEIIMKKINDKIVEAILDNFASGLENAIEGIIEDSKKLEKEVREEQHFDTTAYRYNTLNRELNRLVQYYNNNEKEIFADTMLNWAILAGFKEYSCTDEGIVEFEEGRFSSSAAANAMFVPPNWKKYSTNERNRYMNHVFDLYEEFFGTKQIRGKRVIRGTFDREQSIKNDYLHFFAPGDEIFDCIVENALKSSKGQVAAFACKSAIEWKGIVFTWSMELNEKILLDQGMSLTNVSRYRNFLAMEQLHTFIPINANYQDITEATIRAEFNRILSRNFNEAYKGNNMAHLGSRDKEDNYDFLEYTRKYNQSNIERFKEMYPKEVWEQFVEDAYKAGYEKAKKEFIKRSNIRGAKEEMSKLLATRKATDQFYEHKMEDLKQFETMCDLIMQSLSKPKIILESACFVWMVKQ